MTRLIHITTVPESFVFIAGQIRFLKKRGYDVVAVSSPGKLLDTFAEELDIPAYGVRMPRSITPLADASAVATLTDLMLDLAPDIVHAHTPKGGLLGMTAAAAAQVPVRIYHMRGLLTFTATGLKRRLFLAAERTSCRLAHRVVCQSHSLRNAAIDQCVVSAEKSEVLLQGSNGVDARGRFNPEHVVSDVRALYGIPEDALVVGFVGRLVRDKGIVELVDAWKKLRAERDDVHLLVVGPFETRDPVPKGTARVLRDDRRVHLVGFTRETPRYYRAMDVLALPTYREGFPNVPLEAAAMGIPTVATKVPGCVDAIDDGKTGLLVPARDAYGLAEALRMYLQSPQLRAEHGAAARARVLESFDPEKISQASLDLYSRLLHRASRP